MKVITNIFSSSLGKKYIMAVSGLVMFLFVIGHLAGNLQFFLGAESINRYGHFLQTNLELHLAGAHRSPAWCLSCTSGRRSNSRLKTKPRVRSAYANWNPTVATYASRTMLMSGLIVFAFIIYHLLHFTVQVQSHQSHRSEFRTILHDPQEAPRHFQNDGRWLSAIRWFRYFISSAWRCFACI